MPAIPLYPKEFTGGRLALATVAELGRQMADEMQFRWHSRGVRKAPDLREGPLPHSAGPLSGRADHRAYPGQPPASHHAQRDAQRRHDGGRAAPAVPVAACPVAPHHLRRSSAAPAHHGARNPPRVLPYAVPLDRHGGARWRLLGSGQPHPGVDGSSGAFRRALSVELDESDDDEDDLRPEGVPDERHRPQLCRTARPAGSGRSVFARPGCTPSPPT